MSAPGTIEDDIVRKWLYDTLAAIGGLVAILGTAADSTPMMTDDPAPSEWGEGPVLTWGPQSLVDVRGVGTARIMANDLWLVKVTGRLESSDLLTEAAALADAALSDTTAHVTGGTILMSHREARYRSAPSDEQGTTWRSVGGIYRILSQ